MAASTNLTPEQRIQRARKAALKRTSLDHYVKSVVDRAPELTEDQKVKLRAILAPSEAA